MKLLKEPECVIRDGKPSAVILPIKDYEALLSALKMRKTHDGSRNGARSR